MSTLPGSGASTPARRRSKAWVYYAVLAVLSVFAVASTHGASLIVTVLLGPYSWYLFRGGRIVIWLW